MTEQKFLKIFNQFIKNKYVTKAAASKAWGCTPAYTSYCSLGCRTPTDIMLADMGMKRNVKVTVTYERI